MNDSDLLGEMAPAAREMFWLRWMVEVVSQDGQVSPVGDLSAHAVWYGPTIASKAMNIRYQSGRTFHPEVRSLGVGEIPD